jgi:hypothetical protein
MKNEDLASIQRALYDSMQTFDAQGDHLSAQQCDTALTALARIAGEQELLLQTIGDLQQYRPLWIACREELDRLRLGRDL